MQLGGIAAGAEAASTCVSSICVMPFVPSHCTETAQSRSVQAIPGQAAIPGQPAVNKP